MCYKTVLYTALNPPSHTHTHKLTQKHAYRSTHLHRYSHVHSHTHRHSHINIIKRILSSLWRFGIHLFTCYGTAKRGWWWSLQIAWHVIEYCLPSCGALTRLIGALTLHGFPDRLDTKASRGVCDECSMMRAGRKSPARRPLLRFRVHMPGKLHYEDCRGVNI